MHRSRLVVAVLVVLLAACGGPTDAVSQDGDGTPTPTEELGAKPEVTIPSDDPAPTDLVVEDLVEGTGAEAAPGSIVTVHYVGVAWSSGEQFDASWDRGQPFVFELGAGAVIPGWDRGVDGMRVGGRRQLIIPPELAYGESGAGEAIGPDETLVFVVDLLDARAPSPTPGS